MSDLDYFKAMPPDTQAFILERLDPETKRRLLRALGMEDRPVPTPAPEPAYPPLDLRRPPMPQPGPRPNPRKPVMDNNMTPPALPEAEDPMPVYKGRRGRMPHVNPLQHRPPPSVWT